MKKIIAKINFSINGADYIAKEEIDIKDYKTIVRLNEKGYIEPLTYEDLVLIQRELKKTKKEEVL